MSVQPQIRSFFKPAARYEVLMQKDKDMDKITEKNEKMAVEHAKKTAEFEEKKREAEAAKKRKQRSVEDQMNLLIDEPKTVLIFGSSGTHYWKALDSNAQVPEVTFVEDNYEEPAVKKRKTWRSRPDQWKTILEYFIHCGYNVPSTRAMYRDFFGNYDDRAAYKVLMRWKVQYLAKREMKNVGATASYGKEIDDL